MGGICSSNGPASHRTKVQRYDSKPLAKPSSMRRTMSSGRDAGGSGRYSGGRSRYGSVLANTPLSSPEPVDKGFDCPINLVRAPSNCALEAMATQNVANSGTASPEEHPHHPLDALALRPSLKLDTERFVEAQLSRHQLSKLGLDERQIRRTSRYGSGMTSLSGSHYYPIGLGPKRPSSQEDRLGAPLPTNEAFRMNVLGNFRILDTPKEPKYDRLTSLAAKLFQTPVALISLVDNNRQWFKSEVGLGISETDRESSFCAYVLLPAKNPCLVVENALQDKRFYRSKLVTGEPYIRFYAGAPLLTSDNFILGSLCVIDFVPRTFSDHDCELLMTIASLVTLEIEKHTKSLELQRVQIERFEEDKRGLLQAIDAFNEGLVLADVAQPGEPIVFVNEGFERITGYSIQDVIGANCGKILQGEKTDSAAVLLLRDAVRDMKAASVEILNYKKDGTPFWNWLRIRPVGNNNKDLVKRLPDSPLPLEGSAPRSSAKPPERQRQYFYGIISDITARKEREEELAIIKMAEMKSRASQLAKREFVANVSHEIRTPINAILACSQLLHDMSGLNAEQLELAQMISGSGQQLLCLVNDILDFSKLEAGKMDLQVREFNIWQCMDFCMEMLRLKCEDKGLHLSFFVDPSTPTWIWSDEVRFRQVIANLLSNAAKFTDEGGEVELGVMARQLAASDSEEQPAGASTLPVYEVQVTVRDTGIGMPSEFQKVIFEAFTQCDNSRTRKYEGTGLGMAISKDLTEKLGGRIWVESAIGRGSQFHFTIVGPGSFTESKGAPIPLQVALVRPQTPISGLRALLVGENAMFQRMLGSILLSWGIQATTADSISSFKALWRCHSDAAATAKASSSGETATQSGEEDLAGEAAAGKADLERTASGSGASTSQAMRESPTHRGSRGSLPPHIPSLPQLPFELVIIDGPRTSGPQNAAGERPPDGGVALAELACTCSETLTTIVLCRRPDRPILHQQQTSGAEILSRPVRVTQLYNCICKLLTRGDKQAPLPGTGNTGDSGKAILQPAPSLQREWAQSLDLLVADDSFVNQKVLVKLLKSLGQSSCFTAINGLQVLKAMRARTYDIILMDLQMPEMDGLTATTKIRAEWPREQQPFIVALTADVGGGIEMECRAAGMNSYLSKPIMKESLVSLLRNFTSLKDSGKWMQESDFWLDSVVS